MEKKNVKGEKTIGETYISFGASPQYLQGTHVRKRNQLKTERRKSAVVTEDLNNSSQTQVQPGEGRWAQSPTLRWGAVGDWQLPRKRVSFLSGCGLWKKNANTGAMLLSNVPISRELLQDLAILLPGQFPKLTNLGQHKHVCTYVIVAVFMIAMEGKQEMPIQWWVGT